MQALSLAVVVNIILIVPVFAQPQATYSVGKANVRQWTVKEGLSQSSVNAILQDKQGFLWFGTQDGLNKFDGYTFTVNQHTPGDTTTIGDNFIQTLFEDKAGIIWLGTRYGLTKLDPATNKVSVYASNGSPQSLNAKIINSIVQDASGALWMGTGRLGIRRMDIQAGTFSAFMYNVQSPHESQVSSAPELIKIPYSGYNLVHSLTYSPTGDIWMTTRGGLLQWQAKENRFKPYQGIFKELQGLAENQPFHDIFKVIHADKKGVVWVSSEKGGLYKLKPTAREFEKITLPDEIPLQESIFQLITDGSNNSLWLTSKTHLYRYFPESNQFIYYPQAFPENALKSETDEHLWSILEDKDGVVWVGLELGGIRQLDIKGGGFHLYQPAFVKKEDKVFNLFLEDTEGSTWLATSDAIFYYNKKMNKVRHISRQDNPLSEDNPVISPFISSLFEDPRGNIWIGSRKGLLQWIRKTDTFIKYLHNPADSTSISSNEIISFFEDESGAVWIGTGIGINRFDHKTSGFQSFMLEQTRSGAAGNLVNSTISLDENRLLVGTENGLFILHKKTGEKIRFRRPPQTTSPDTISNNQITYLFKSSRNQYWVGTANGLNLFDPVSTRFKSYFTRDGLSNNYIAGIREDAQGYLWISTNKGITRFDPQRETFQNYDKIEGQVTPEFYDRAAFQSSQGEMLFGSIDGLVSFYPQSLKPNQVIPPVYITNYRIFDKKVPLQAKRLEIAYDQNHIGFDFIALNYLNPDKNQYAYKMEGFDRDWTYSGTRHFTNYTNLSPGTYTFTVRASNNDGVWNKQGASVTVVILPPWYRTVWAYLGYCGILLSLLYFSRKALIQRERLKADLRIRQVEADKLKELDGLKSRFFANISHEFRTPLTLILNIVKDTLAHRKGDGLVEAAVKGKELETVHRNAERLRELIEQLLDLSKIEAGSLTINNQAGDLMMFIRYVASAFHSLAQSRQIHYQYQITPDTLWVNYDRDKIEKIVTNLLSNALKFTPQAGKVLLEVTAREQVAGSEVVFSVTDTGIGIPQEEQSRIFDRFYQVDPSTTRAYEGSGIGLALSKELVELYGGSITVNSQPGEGTLFTVRLVFESTQVTHNEVRSAEWPERVREAESLEGAIPEEESVGAGDYEEKVLIVEDNSDLRAYLKDSLLGRYQVLEAADGAEGLTLALREIPDLVISDVMMSVMDGFTLCDRLKTDERTSHIPVILLTAKAGAENKLAGLQLGADDYLIKPFDSRELLLRARNLLENRKKLWERYSKEFILQPAQISLPSTDEKFLSKLRQVIEENLSEEDFSVEGLGEAMAMSRVQLYRKLFALTSQSPSDLIRSMRLQRARQLLESRAGNISEIAYQVGFKNLAHFSKSFSREFGQTPSDFMHSPREKI